MSDEADTGRVAGCKSCIETGNQVKMIANEDGSDVFLYVNNKYQIITKPRLDFDDQRSTFTWKNEPSGDFAITLHNDSVFYDAVVGIERFSEGQPLTLQNINKVRIWYMNLFLLLMYLFCSLV